MIYPKLRGLKASRLWTEQFGGLDRRPRPRDGAFAAMGNMTGDPWPLISSRKKRGLVAELTEPLAMAALGKLAWIDGSTLYYGGEATALNDLSTADDMLPKRIVTMGAYLLILPDKRYYNTADPSDTGGVERLWQSQDSVTFALCDGEGTPYDDEDMYVCGADPREDAQQPAQEGDLWLNTAEEPNALYRLTGGEWIAIPSLYVRIGCPGIGAGLNVQDGIRISGVQYSGYDAALGAQLEALNGTHTVQARSDSALVIPGVIRGPYTQLSGAVRADRRMPRMDFCVECNNRLWGCRYGEQAGETVNEIYACALGDFKNWDQFMGVSTDSYAASVGSDGPFTGAAVHQGCPHFFKADCVHKVYGSLPRNFQTLLTECDGVKAGCGGSLAACNGALYYVSANGVEVFESLPQGVGAALGETRFTEAVGGQAGGKYYLSAKDEGGRWSLYVLDTLRGVWHRQDDSHALAFAALDGEMYMLESSGLLWSLNGAAGEREEDVTWYAETAALGYETPDHKYLSRFLLRMRLGKDAECAVSIQYDGDGQWHPKGAARGTDRVKTYLLPVIPRRCEYLKLRLEGHGEMCLFGLAREMVTGRD